MDGGVLLLLAVVAGWGGIIGAATGLVVIRRSLRAVGPGIVQQAMAVGWKVDPVVLAVHVQQPAPVVVAVSAVAVGEGQAQTQVQEQVAGNAVVAAGVEPQVETLFRADLAARILAEAPLGPRSLARILNCSTSTAWEYCRRVGQAGNREEGQ